MTEPDGGVTDMRCMVCGDDVFGMDKGSISLVEWVPSEGNALRAMFCTKPECLRAWAFDNSGPDA